MKMIGKIFRKIIYNFQYSCWNWWWYDIKYPIINFFHYLPVIWTDRSWEYIGLYQLMEKKLEQLEEQHKKYGNHTSCPRNARDIHRTRLALKRIIEDKYIDLVYMQHDKKWGKTNFDSQPSDWDDTGKPTLYRMYVTRENVRTEKEIRQEAAEYRRLMDRMDILENQDLDYVFRMLKRHSRGWWD